MKKITSLLSLAAAFCVLIFTFLACKKENPTTIQVDLPDDIEFGKVVLYLNGEVTTVYQIDCQLDTVYNLVNYVLLDAANANIITSFGFAWLPIEEGDFILHTERELYLGAKVFFSQTVDEDLDGYEYELIDADEGFLNIEYLDTSKMEVKGRFRVKYKRTSKNGNGDLGLPEYLQFDGAFYDNLRFL